MIKSFGMGNNPVRCAKFIVRKSWVIAGTDDMHLRVYNYNTMEKVKEWEAHTDYIRFVEIHPNRPYILRYAHLDILLLKQISDENMSSAPRMT